MSEIKKTFVSVGNEIHTVDTIMHDGRWWLVPMWADYPDEGYTIPGRIICLSGLRYEPSPGMDADYTLVQPLSDTLLYGRPTEAELAQYEVLPLPDIRFPIPPEDAPETVH